MGFAPRVRLLYKISELLQLWAMCLPAANRGALTSMQCSKLSAAPAIVKALGTLGGDKKPKRKKAHPRAPHHKSFTPRAPTSPWGPPQTDLRNAISTPWTYFWGIPTITLEAMNPFKDLTSVSSEDPIRSKPLGFLCLRTFPAMSESWPVLAAFMELRDLLAESLSHCAEEKSDALGSLVHLVFANF